MDNQIQVLVLKTPEDVKRFQEKMKKDNDIDIDFRHSNFPGIVCWTKDSILWIDQVRIQFLCNSCKEKKKKTI